MMLTPELQHLDPNIQRLCYIKLLFLDVFSKTLLLLDASFRLQLMPENAIFMQYESKLRSTEKSWKIKIKAKLIKLPAFAPV